MTIDSTPDAAATEPRSCTVCLARDRRRPATHVARDAGGLEWFECGSHHAFDNVAGTLRLALEPIATWFKRRGVPLPEGADELDDGSEDLTPAAGTQSDEWIGPEVKP
jgi:hypothetical protein